jgi:Domain of unknown function (DUF4904)
MRDEVVRVVELYLRGLAAGDLGDVPLHPDVDWQGPLGHSVKGANLLRAMLRAMSPHITGVTIIRHIVELEWCATIFELTTAEGVLSVLDCFQVVDGQIRSIRVFLDRHAIIA